MEVIFSLPNSTVSPRRHGLLPSFTYDRVRAIQGQAPARECLENIILGVLVFCTSVILRVSASFICTLSSFCLPLILSLFRLPDTHICLSPVQSKEFRLDCYHLSSPKDGVGPFSGPWRIMVYKGLLRGFNRSNQSRTKCSSPSNAGILQKGNQPIASLFGPDKLMENLPIRVDSELLEIPH